MRSWLRVVAAFLTGIVAAAACARADMVSDPAAEPATLRSLWSVQLLRAPAFERQLEAARELNLRHVRIAARWSETERAGTYDWRLTDSRIAPILTAGLAPLITIMGPHPDYDATAGGAAAAASSDRSIEAYARFAGAVASRYARPGVRFEIWNEPNIKTFWKPKPDAAAYAKLATRACEAIHAAKPDALVFVLGMNGTPVDREYQGQYQAWSRAAMTPELMACADGISLHPYARKQPESYQADLPKIVALLAPFQTAGGPAKRIMISEWGTPLAAKWQLDADAQANRDIRILLVGALTRQQTNLFTMMTSGKNLNDPEQTFGLLDGDGQPKQAYRMVQTLLNRVGDYRLASSCDGCSDSFILRLTPPAADTAAGPANEQVAYIAWTTADPLTLSLPGDLGSRAQAVDLVAGTAREIGAKTVAIGPRPILLLPGS